MPRTTAMELYKLLPKTNCKDCGENTCMSFAIKLIDRGRKLGECPYIVKENLGKLMDMVTPPVKEVRFGHPEGMTLGGEEVMYRHELKFFNPCRIAVDVSDTMPDAEIDGRINFVKNFVLERIGEKLRLDAIAVRCASKNPEKYAKTVERVAKSFNGPMVLCSFDPKALEAGLKKLDGRRPLIYAANEKNWEKVNALSERYNAPMAVYSNDFDMLGSIASNLGHDNVVLDPGTMPVGSGLKNTIEGFTMLRKSAVKNVRELGYPLMGVPAIAWTGTKDRIMAAYYETVLACALLSRFASLIVVHSIEPWSLIHMLTLRQNIYTDPRTEPEVDAKLYEIGKPGENSPVFVTTNFSLTYFTVAGDLQKSSIDSYLLVVGTKGFAVDTAIATGDLSGSKIREAIENSKLADKVKHRKLILPMFASQIRGTIEDETGWEVLIGPRDSSEIGKFVKEKWR
ncbi:MAG: acetyl-CoA decarbonylase/synthase complex subunit gamma [Candidatus Altiarchaeota archaeon]